MTDTKDDLAIEAILERTIPGFRDEPATCRHRCDCECHRNPSVVHCAPCCTGCGHGHTQILDVYLHAHLKSCHGIEQP